MSFYREIGEIYRLKVPFDGEVYTSVFLIKNAEGNVLIDCATTAEDVDGYILPALEEAGVPLDKVKYLVLTHQHGDHAGGQYRILQHNPRIKIVTDLEEKLLNGLTVYAMKGHTLDSVGVFDQDTHTLVAGDGLQGYGVGKYRCTLENPDEYLKTIGHLKKDGNITNVLFSHAYEPWYKDGAFGREEVERCLQDCINYVKGE